jgi:hypothetical protein
MASKKGLSLTKLGSKKGDRMCTRMVGECIGLMCLGAVPIVTVDGRV